MRPHSTETAPFASNTPASTVKKTTNAHTFTSETAACFTHSGRLPAISAVSRSVGWLSVQGFFPLKKSPVRSADATCTR